MKKSEIAMIILIASISMMIAFLVASNIPQLKPSDTGVDVEQVDPIKPDIANKPSADVFNSNAINPTVQAVIGGQPAAEQTLPDDQPTPGE